MLSRLELRFGTLLLSGALGTLALGIIGFGWLTYHDLNATILRGFDEKLKALSTSSAVFVDGDLHAFLGTPRALTGIAADPATGVLWGLESTSGLLVQVGEEGWIEPVAPLPDPYLSGLAWEAPGRLVAVSRVSGVLWSNDLSTGVWSREARIGAGLRDLASQDDGSVLWAAAPQGLRAYDRQTGRLLPDLSDSSLPSLAGVTVLPDGAVFVVSLREGRLFRRGAGDASFEEVGRLSWVSDDVEDEGIPAPWIREGIDVHPLSQQLVGVGDRLWYVDPDRGDLTAPADLPGFRGGQEAAYQQYRVPMSRIMERQDVTYLYSQELLSPDGEIVYVLDGTQGDDYSPPGTPDLLPAEDARGAMSVLRTGGVYLSRIQAWDQWGLLKAAFAPIEDSEGRPVAMVGADVNISIIGSKTQTAIARVGVLGMVALLVGLFVTVRLTRWLIVPLREVRDGALRMASGDFRHRIKPQPVLELDQLGRAVNRTSEVLQARASLQRKEGETLRRLHLDQQVAEGLAASPSPGSLRVVWIERDESPREPGEVPDDLQRIRQLEAVLSSLEQAHRGTPPAEVVSGWAGAFGSFVVIWSDGTTEAAGPEAARWLESRSMDDV